MELEQLLDPLVESDHVTGDQRDEVLDSLRTERDPTAEDLFEELVEINAFDSTKTAIREFSNQYGMEFVDLESHEVDSELIQLMDSSTAQQYFVFPVSRDHQSIKLAAAEPPDIRISDDLEALLESSVEFCLADPDELRDCIEEHYGTSLEEITEVLDDIGEDDVAFVDSSDEEQDVAQLEEQAEEAPVIKLVNMIILEAVERGTSDIHIEPLEDKLLVRYRIDGVLHEVHEPPKDLQGAIISRIKIMADMDIAERRVPQDGRIKMKVMGKQLDFRVSALPGIHGESMVLRILDKEAVGFDMGELGFLPDNKAVFDQLIRRPHGIILVTGPTGSGKTTTLYSALSEINNTDLKLITIEDPVEYQIEGINQMQVKEEIGLDFAEGLRTLLRQNPDVILVGEIRDYETAETAIRSAMTGHLVFSTLHTNDAPSAINRLVDLGVDPFLISSSVQAIMAQRLVRSICDNCKYEYEPDETYLREVGFPLEDAEKTTFYQGKGCPGCDGTGYSGRTAIFELMVNTESINDAILNGATSDKLRDIARQDHMRTLRDDGFIKVRMGETTLMEVARVTQSHGEVAAV